MYTIKENGIVVQQSDLPVFEIEDETSHHAFKYEPDFEKARAVLVQPDTEGEEGFHANIDGREPYDWVNRTVEVVKE